MSSLAAFLSRFRSMEADEMIDLKALAARHSTKQRPTAKSLFTKPIKHTQNWRYKINRIGSKLPSSQSQISVADIAVTRATWNEGFVAGASGCSVDIDTGVDRNTCVYTPTGHDEDNAPAPRTPVSPPSYYMPGSDVRSTPTLVVSMPELHGEAVFENDRRKDSLQVSLSSNSIYSTPELLQPASSLYSPFCFRSSISDISTGNWPMDPVEAEIIDELPANSTGKPLFRKTTKKITGATEKTKKSTKSNKKQQKPSKVKQDFRNKPLPPAPVSVATAKIPRESPLRASNHVANLMSKYAVSGRVWTDSDESPTDKYFHPHPMVKEKQGVSDLEFELRRTPLEKKDHIHKEEHVVAPLKTRKAPPIPYRGHSGSGDLPGPKTRLESTSSTNSTPKLDLKVKPTDSGSRVSLQDNKAVLAKNADAQNANAIDVAGERDQQSNVTNLSTISASTSIRTGITSQRRPTIVSKYSEILDDIGLYTRSFIVDPSSIPSSVEVENAVVEDDNDIVPHGDKICIKLSHVESVTLNFHFPSSFF